MFGIADNPAAYPFSLSERKFGYYATTTFGGTMGDIEGIYLRSRSMGRALALLADRTRVCNSL